MSDTPANPSFFAQGATRKGFQAALCILLWAVPALAAQTDSISAYRDPVELVRKVVQNECKIAGADNARFLFRGDKTTPKGSVTRLYVETREGTASLTVANDGKPLTPEQQRAEQERVERLVSNPEELKKKLQQEHENNDRSLRIVRALPDAFLYEYAGEEPGSNAIGRAGSTLVKVKFAPNPKYEPPSKVEEVLTGMQGFILIDAPRLRLASIDGTLFKEVGFGWGILGHLDRGGHFTVQSQQVEENDWEPSSMGLKFTGKLLLFKSLYIDSTEVFSGFRRVPSDLTFAQGVELLKKEVAGANTSAKH